MAAQAPPEKRGHDYLRPSEVARLLGVCGATVRNLIRSGDLGAVRTPGGHYRVRSEDATAMLARLAA